MNDGADRDRTEFDVHAWAKLYEIYRGHVNSENEHYNQRVLWLVTMQACLFATVGLIFQSHDDTSTFGYFLHDAMYVMIAFSGILIAIVCRRKLTQAMDAITQVTKQWSIVKELIPEGTRRLFPAPGGLQGSNESKRLGWLLRSRNFPLLFACTWLAFLLSWLLFRLHWTY